MVYLLPQNYLQWTLLSGAFLVAVALRLPGLTAELNHDEAFTWLSFASQPYVQIISDYSLPNNHLFHTLLVRLSTQTFGQTEWAMRLPALLAGILAIPAIYLLGRAFSANTATGLIAAWLLALAPIHISYSRMARGYSLLVLCTILSILALHQALKGPHRAWWSLFVPSAFLSTYTLPSGALHLAALGSWGLFVSWREGKKPYATLGFHALTGALLVCCYWPLRADLVQATAKWGVAIDGDLTILFQLLSDVAQLCAGGPWPQLLLPIALLGFALLVRRRNSEALYLVAVWTLPFVLALALGTAGQPRSYLFLLPSFILALALATAWFQRYRLIFALALLVPYAASYRPSTGTASYAATEHYLRQTPSQSRVVVTPFIMGIPLWYYAQTPIIDGLEKALSTHHIEDLLVATHVDDDRFSLAHYLASGNIGYDSRYVSFARGSFAKLHQAGHVVLNRITNKGQRIFPRQPQQEWKQVDTAVHLSGGDKFLSHWPSMRITNPAAAPFALYSAERFSLPDSGLVVLSYALTEPDTRATLYAFESGQIVAMEMLRTSETGQRHSPEGRTWFLESHIAPIRPGVSYGVYIRGNAANEQYLADLFCMFFPY